MDLNTSSTLNTTTELGSNFAPAANIAIGALLCISCVPGLVCNGLLMFLVGYGGYLSSKRPVIYQMAFNLALVDFMELLGIVGYLGPSIILQDWMLPSEEARFILGAASMALYYIIWAMVVLIALNRYFTVCRAQQNQEFPTYQQALFINIAAWPVAVVVSTIIAVFSQYKEQYNYRVYSFSYFGCCGFNYRSLAFEQPVNALVTFVLLVCYGSIFRKIHISRGEIQSSRPVAAVAAKIKRRRQREIRLAVQFAAISGFFTFTWLFFDVFPLILSNPDLRLYSVITFLYILNSTVNGAFSLAYNEELWIVLMSIISGTAIVHSNEHNNAISAFN